MKQLLFAAIFLFASCQKSVEPLPATQIALTNPGFEEKLTGWTVETLYTGMYGFSADTAAKSSGNYGLNFYAAQPGHWNGAPQETPWNGKIYQVVTGLVNGKYELKVTADAVGNGMLLYAGNNKQFIKSDVAEVNTLEFTVTGGSVEIGFVCIDAGGPQTFAPYFHADNFELWKK